MIKAIIFDIGGVIAYDVWEHLLLDKDYGIASMYKQEAAQVMKVGRELWEAYAYMPTSIGKDWRDLEKEYWHGLTKRLRITISDNAIYSMTDYFIKPINGMVQLLKNLQHLGIEIAICSNNTDFWFERQKEKLNLLNFFSPDKIILSSRIGVSKRSNNLEMFRAVLNTLKARTDECIFVDDRKANIEKALTLGVAGILFPSHSNVGAKYLTLLLKKMKVFE